jgi:hypothetical protein
VTDTLGAASPSPAASSAASSSSPAPAPAPTAAPAPAPASVPRGALPPLTRGWIEITLGNPRPEILSVHGRGPDDVWLLTKEQEVLHFDGKRVARRYAKPCGWGDASGSGVGTRLHQIVVDDAAVHVLGELRGPESRVGSALTASLSRAGKWSCVESGMATIAASSAGKMTWQLGHNFQSGPCFLRVLGGPCATTPEWAPSYLEPSGDAVDSGIHSIALSMAGVDDGWIVTVDADGTNRLLRYDGVTWFPKGAIERPARLVDMWVDDRRSPWLLTGPGWWNRDKKDAPPTRVLRFEDGALRPFPVPGGFDAGIVRGTSAKDVWFVGANAKAYQWDGEVLREGEVPFDAAEAWSSPGGQVWIVDGDRVARTADLAGER